MNPKRAFATDRLLSTKFRTNISSRHTQNLMKTFRFVLLALTLFVASSFAGEIYGTIKQGKDLVPKSTTIEIKSSAKTYSAVTDEFGNYRVAVAETGKCEFTVHFKDQSVSAEMQSYWNPSRFDWVLEKSGDKYSLKRQ